MPTNDDTDFPDEMDEREAALHARLTEAFTEARGSVRNDDAQGLVETARQRRATRHVDAVGPAAGATRDGNATSRMASSGTTSRRRSRWVTIGVPAAAAIIVLAVIGGILASRNKPTLRASFSASCLMSVTFQGRHYIGNTPGVSYTVAERIGSGVIPPCNDTGRDNVTEEGESVPVYRVEGLDPRDGIAIRAGDQPSDTALLGVYASGNTPSQTPAFQAFVDAHRTPTTIEPATPSSLPPPHSSIPGTTPGSMSGTPPTTMADGNPSDPPSSGTGTQTSFDPRCPADATHTSPTPPAPAHKLLTATPSEAVVCTYPVSFDGQDARRSNIVSDQATLQRLTREISALQAPGPELACTAEKGPDLAIVVIEGSRQRTIWVELYGCGTVTDGTNLFIGGKSLAWLTER